MQQTKNIKDLFADEVRSFSIYDCQRSLPSGVDGLKPAMRKIIYGMLKKFPSQEVKVSIAAAGIQECVTGDMVVTLSDGSVSTIDELVSLYGTYVPFDIKSYNQESNSIEADSGMIIDKGETQELYEIELITGEIIRCTSTHRFLTPRGWIPANELLESDSILSE